MTYFIAVIFVNIFFVVLAHNYIFVYVFILYLNVGGFLKKVKQP